MEFVLVLFGICVLLAGYIAWRDRKRGRAHHGQPFVEHGEAKSAAYLSDLGRAGQGGGGA